MTQTLRDRHGRLQIFEVAEFNVLTSAFFLAYDNTDAVPFPTELLHSSIALCWLGAHETDLRSGRFAHYTPDALAYDWSIRDVSVPDFDAMLAAAAELERPWTVNVVGRVRGKCRITFSFERDIDAVEFRLRCP